MLSQKLGSITPSYTIEISRRVSELIKEGKDIINFSIGEPDFNIPQKSMNAMIEALSRNATKYDNVSGLAELRKAIIKKLNDENNLNYDTDDIVVSNGAKHAITNSLIALLNPNDEVLVPKPYWVSYPEMIKLVGGVPVFLETTKETSYKVTPEIISSGLSSKTKMIFLTNPSNPSGIVYSEDELMKIGNYCVEKGIYILADEIYERITFDSPFVSIASLSESIKDMTITINGFSKSFAMTGLRIGYSASNKKIAKAISSIQGHLVSHPSTISQWGAAAALNECRDEVEKMKEEYKQRRNIAVSLLDKIPQLPYVNPQGAFYLWLDISNYKDKIVYDGSYSVAFSNELLQKGNVAVVPGIAFGEDDFIRISYACSKDTIREGFKRIESFLRTL
ncbi:MAG: pyridoxal phosphate-dependent aminotransferase [Clostridiales bacterium]|nr:pyridoxal phosphate-dependent aminotransferase [Clostridiales bacterium]